MPAIARNLALVLFAVPSTALAADPSNGIYRIPFVDGTSMKVNQDHLTHSPTGRIDLGASGSDVRIAAAADGKVEGVVDTNSARQDSGAGVTCNNNYIWLSHANGEWSKYTHMKKGSISGKAGLKVGDSVKAGQYLGDYGEVGRASGPHLHFEVAVPPAKPPFFSPVGGFITGGNAQNRNPRICGTTTGFFVKGESFTAKAVQGILPSGRPEIARHGVPIADFQCLFNQAARAGYEVTALDMFDSGGTLVNVVLRPASAAGAVAHGMTGAAYQAKLEELKAKGYRLVLVESYQDDGVRYAAVWKKGNGVAQAAYHGKSAAEHQALLDDLTAKGFRPRTIWVVSDGGTRRYTALYEKADVGSWQAKSQLTPAEYQALFNENDGKGRQVVYLNAYTHSGAPFIVAIWNAKTNAAAKAKHGMTAATYQSEYDSARTAGLLTRTVTGYRDGGVGRYAAVWRD